jgi:dTDP-4-amino-4,6-dideoxygalactose transaminase
MAVPRHNVNLTSDELRWMASTLSGRGDDARGRALFESALCDYLGVAHVRAVDSGRVALHLALDGLGLSPGDRVVLPRYCFYSLAHVIEGLCLEPIWAPVDPATLALDPARLGPLVDGAKAVILIHPFGQVGPLRAIREISDAAGIPLIEDGSQATGGALGSDKVGALGTVGVFSMVSGKNLQTFGGGFVSTNDDDLIRRVDARLEEAEPVPAARVKAAMYSGAMRWFLTTPLGYGGLMHPLTLGLQTLAPRQLEAMFHEERAAYDPKRSLHRLSDAQGHLGCLDLEQLDRRNQIRRNHALRLIDGLRGLSKITLPHFDSAADNTFNALAIRVQDGPRIQRDLRLRGVDTRSDYMSWYGQDRDFAEDVVYLPNHPGLRSADVDMVVRAVRAVLS